MDKIWRNFFLWILGITFLSGSDSTDTSFWGKPVDFLVSSPSCYWQLSKTCTVPALGEFSVCVDVRRQIDTADWTAFVYKKPREGRVESTVDTVELGLAGSRRLLKAWLFGQEWTVPYNLTLKTWHTVCLTWSGRSRQFQLFINYVQHLNVHVNGTLQSDLASNGTLTLGVSHSFVGGTIDVETGKNFLGQMHLFRMWDSELSLEHLVAWKCVSGNVVSWRARDWDYHACPPAPDLSLTCEWSMYEIKMNISVIQNSTDVQSAETLQAILLIWLESVFLENMSVYSIVVSPASPNASNILREHDQGEIQQCRKSQNSPMETWVHSLIYLHVSPAADVAHVQAEITGRLAPSYSQGVLTLTVETATLDIIPVGAFPNMTPPAVPTNTLPPTVCESPDSFPFGFTQKTSSDSTGPIAPNCISTTASSLDCTNPFFADTFFRVHMNLSINGNSVNPEHIENSLQQTFKGHQMVILNFMLPTGTNDRNYLYHGKSPEIEASLQISKCYSATFQVMAKWPSNVTVAGRLIFNLLTNATTGGSSSFVVPPDQVEISEIVPRSCPEDPMQTLYGFYIWPCTEAEGVAEMICEKSRNLATRLCKLNATTDMAEWALPDLGKCRRIVTDIGDLDQITVTQDNSADVVDMIGALVSNHTELNWSQLDVVLGKLSEIISVSNITSVLAEHIVTVVSDILDSIASLSRVTNSILNLVDRLGDKMNFLGDSHKMTTPIMALQLVSVDASDFHGLTFSVSDFQDSIEPDEITVNNTFVDKPVTGTVASVALPSCLEDFFPQGDKNKPRIQFQFYGIDSLFKDTSGNMALNSYVVSASISNASVNGLRHPVVIMLRHHRTKEENDKVLCVYWDFHKNNGNGGWEGRGCEAQSTNATHTTCFCNHLTHFGVLLDISRTPISAEHDFILTIISYLGCGMSSVFLGVTLVTYLAFEKLRRDYPSKILINLSVALLGLNLVFLVNSWFASFNSESLCVGVAATLHYFFLASFTWMGLEAVNMYLALVKVFNVYVRSYILKFCIVGWGVPLLIVSLVLCVQVDSYGPNLYEDSLAPTADDMSFCWLQLGMTFYITVVSYVVLIMLCNVSVFGVVLVQIRRMQANQTAGSTSGLLHDLKVVASLTILLGLTWILAFFSFGVAKTPLLYIFSFLNSLQGFFIFVFHCLMKENVRKQWRIHLCCGRFRLTDYSDWSRSVTLGGRVRGSPLVHSPSVRSETTNDSRKTSDSLS